MFLVNPAVIMSLRADPIQKFTLAPSIEPTVLLDVLSGTQDRSAQSCGLVRGGVQVIEDHFLQIGLDFLHLSEDHPSLPLDLCLAQHAVLDDISQDLHSWNTDGKLTASSAGIQLICFNIITGLINVGLSWFGIGIEYWSDISRKKRISDLI